MQLSLVLPSFLFLSCLSSSSAKFFLANHAGTEMKIGKISVQAGGFIERNKNPRGPLTIKIEGEAPVKLRVPQDTDGVHAGVVRDADGKVQIVDANQIQLELAEAAKACDRHDYKCVGRKAFGGLPAEFVEEVFEELWNSWGYWQQCVQDPASQGLRRVELRDGYVAEILREEPRVAAVHDFVTDAECKELIDRIGGNELSRATVGGSGGTSTSVARETLTMNYFVNWDVDDILTLISRRTFDVASQLLGKNIPYEGQEPVNLLHYIKGYEYKPHADGPSGDPGPIPKGARVATTLIYCEAATSGGATVFTASQKVKMQPRPGDILFFSYNPDPESAAVHSACPVIEGNKTTLTQWHRLGVSPEKPWDEFENWGKFHNPYAKSRWKGDRPPNVEL